MQIAVVVAAGWEGAGAADIVAVVRSVADCFPVEVPESRAISLQQTDGDPRALSQLDGAGNFVVRVTVRDTGWAQLAFQFAHEYCHVLADPRTVAFDRFHWIEESMCEAASLFAMRRLSLTWRTAPRTGIGLTTPRISQPMSTTV